MADPTTREESERAVLGAAIHGGPDDKAQEHLRNLLPLDSFTIPAHLKLWQAICDLVDNGRPCDSTAVCDELGAQGALETVGGPAYLQSLYDAIPMNLDLDAHVEILLDAMRGRRWLARQRLAAAALQEGEPLSTVRRLDDEAAAMLEAPDRSRPRGDCLADVRARGVTSPVRLAISGRGTEDGRGTDLGHIIGSLFPGQIGLVAGPTGAGKTALLSSMAIVAARAGTHVGYIALEESQEEIEVRLGAALAWVDIWRIQANRYTGTEQAARVDAAITTLRSLPLWVEWLPGGTARDVASAIRDLIHRHGVQLVCGDYIQAICGGSDEYESIRSSIGAIERAQGRDCCSYWGSQVNREGTKSGNPEAHHMRGAGTLEERARKVIVVSKANKEESEIGDDGKPHLARREVKVAVRKNKGEEGEVFGWLHRMKGFFWPGYGLPPWVEQTGEAGQPEQLEALDDSEQLTTGGTF